MKVDILSQDSSFSAAGVEVVALGDATGGQRTLLDHEPLTGVLFLYCARGRADVSLSDAGETALRAGDVFVVFPGRLVTVRLSGSSNRVMFLSLQGPRAVRSVLSLGYWDLFRSNDPYEKDFFSALAKRYETSPDRGRDTLVLQMAERLLTLVWQRLRQGSGKAGFYDIVRAMNALPFGRHTTEYLAESLNISRTKLNDVLRTNGFCRPGEYLARIRLMELQAVLYFTDEPLERIATATGFGSASSMCYFFRKRTGITPAAFRRNPIK